MIERGGDSHYNGGETEIWRMKRFSCLLLLAVGLSFSAGGILHARDLLSVECVPSVVRQGGVCVVTVSSPDSLESIHGEFQAEEFPMARVNRDGVFRALLGIDMKTNPGLHKMTAVGKDADQNVFTEVFLLRVEKATFPIQRLTLPSSMVDLDPKTLERVREESRRVKAVLKGYRTERLWTGPFVRPVEGEVTAAFGVRRILNGQERNPHTGVDLRALEGTPVKACNSGVVVLLDDLFFSGKIVVLDHGWGMYSMYSHLSEALVHLGDTVAKGAIIGLTGCTGRVTGPHLDWKIRLNGARVDPLSVIQLSEYLEE